MGDVLTAEKRAELRELYLELRTVEAVAREGEVAWRTAEKYRIEDNWDRAVERVDRLAEDVAVKKIGKRRADTIRVAYAAIVKMAKGLDKVEELEFSASDVDKMARLIELLSGDVDSRPGHGDVPSNTEDLLIAFSRLSGADQNRVLGKLRGDLEEPANSDA